MPTQDEIKLLGLIALFLLVLFTLLVWYIILHCRKKQAVESTPVTEEGLTQYDDLVPGYAVMLAWSEAGDNPRWHQRMQDDVREKMPVLARALDRMVEINS